MENITNVRDYTVTGKFDIVASFKADGDSVEKKTVTLRFNMAQVPLLEIITPALSTKRINWANGPGRKNFNTWTDRSVIDVEFTSPGVSIKTREQMIAEYTQAFQKAGLDKVKALELATKAVDNPEVIS